MRHPNFHPPTDAIHFGQSLSSLHQQQALQQQQQQQVEHQQLEQQQAVVPPGSTAAPIQPASHTPYPQQPAPYAPPTPHQPPPQHAPPHVTPMAMARTDIQVIPTASGNELVSGWGWREAWLMHWGGHLCHRPLALLVCGCRA